MLRSVNLCAWRWSRALLCCFSEGGSKLYHHVGMFVLSAENKRRERARVCVLVCLCTRTRVHASSPSSLSFLLLISMQTPKNPHCGRHGYTESLIHRRNWRRGISMDEVHIAERKLRFISELVIDDNSFMLRTPGILHQTELRRMRFLHTLIIPQALICSQKERRLFYRHCSLIISLEVWHLIGSLHLDLFGWD